MCWFHKSKEEALTLIMLRITVQKSLNAQRCYRTLFVGHNKATSSDFAIAKSFTSLTLYSALLVSLLL